MDHRFTVPIALPTGGTLRTLSDARAHILALPETEKASKEWQAAAEALLHAANGETGPWLDFARIGIGQALHRHVVKVYDTTRKDPVWRRPKKRA